MTSKLEVGENPEIIRSKAERRVGHTNMCEAD